MHITIIDDERVLGNKIWKKLENEGYTVSNFYTIYEFMHYGDTSSQLYIIDLSLTDGTGYEIITWLRNTAGCKAPIMIVSGHVESQKILYGLNIWADDYITKPFVFEELVARARALFRRPFLMEEVKKLEFKNIILLPGSKYISVNGRDIELTRKEAMIVELFLKDVGKVINRNTLIHQIWWWSRKDDVSDNTINVTLSKIRRKLGSDFSLKTYYNYGYILE